MTAFRVPYTSFGPSGLYEFNRLPFEVKNGSPHFQRAMTEAFEENLVLQDDVAIGSSSEEEHLAMNRAFFEKCKSLHTKISKEKSCLLAKELKYLGRVISKKGVNADSERVGDLQSMKIPKTRETLQSF